MSNEDKNSLIYRKKSAAIEVMRTMCYIDAQPESDPATLKGPVVWVKSRIGSGGPLVAIVGLVSANGPRDALSCLQGALASVRWTNRAIVTVDMQSLGEIGTPETNTLVRWATGQNWRKPRGQKKILTKADARLSGLIVDGVSITAEDREPWIVHDRGANPISWFVRSGEFSPEDACDRFSAMLPSMTSWKPKPNKDNSAGLFGAFPRVFFSDLKR